MRSSLTEAFFALATIPALAQAPGAAPQGQVLRVTYKGQEAEITVPLDVPVVAFVPGGMSLVKPGAAIFIVGQRKLDGSVSVTRANLEKDGIKPPM